VISADHEHRSGTYGCGSRRALGSVREGDQVPKVGPLRWDARDLARSVDPLDLLGAARLAGAATRGAVRARLAPPLSPVRTAQLARALVQWGTTPAVGWSTGCARHPDATAVIDADDATMPGVTFREAERETTAITTGLVGAGITVGTTVGLLGRNSCAYAEAIAAVSRTGADLVYLNTGFTAAQIDEIATRENISWVLCDDDLAERVPDRLLRVSLDGVLEGKSGTLRLRDLAAGRPGRPPDLRRPSRHVILTSGTTGSPRGVARDNAPFQAAVALLDALPFRPRATHILAAPLFHAWGWLNHRICPLYDTTEVLVRRPDGERVLRLAARHHADVIVATPVVLRRMLEVPASLREELDLSALRIVAVSGALIPPDQIVAFTSAFGDVLYNLYGSTEAAFATCADPSDLRADSSTAGRPMPGVRVEVLDSAGKRCDAGTEGMVWVGSRTSFGGYTDGTDRARRPGLVGTGDVGVWDDAGRLRILGRADDTIISGGENVHPEEVEKVLRQHPGVADVAVVGVPDPVFGQVVAAHVVRRTSAVADGEPAADAPEMDWEAAFLAWAAERLAPFQRPRQVVLRADLPCNETGKVLRRLLV
jgi:acyl-CoA synthetase (AMP-forming)/AMP-acid ligase II